MEDLKDYEKEMEAPIGLREEDNTNTPSESLKQRVKENQEITKRNRRRLL